MMRLKNKIAVITAAGQGIGKATAIAFLKEGATVFATDINQEALLKLQKELSDIKIYQLDVTNTEAIKTFSQKITAPDILFNCAGFVASGTILECTEKDWDFSFNLNVKSMYKMIQAFLPGMISKGNASIINMASVASSIKGVPNRFVYSTTKAAVIGLTKSIAADFVGKGIRCNAICPGTVQTPSLDERINAAGGDANKVREAFIARQPIGRIGKPEEIAALAVYLASDEAGFTTGTTHIIDGGWSN
ncbi:MAG: hypothetical protein ACD_60C00025G0065 [uncultured bacterium]|nr:MAG: hypothetical protein ACD_60C00025G0065 [uncultured bacterium]